MSKRYGQGLRLFHFSVGRPCRRADVPERVHALDQNEPPVGMVDQTNVGGETRVGRLRRKLERPGVPRRPTNPQHQLLQRKVAGVGRVLPGIAPEPDFERQVQRERDALPSRQRQRGTVAALDPTYGRL